MSALRAAAERLRDPLTMLGVDPDERPEHGGPTTAETLASAALAVVLASPPPGWYTLGTHIDDPRPLEFWGEGEDGLPVWERPTQPDPLRAGVQALTYASDDGTEYEHYTHPAGDGDPECPACWADSLRALLAETEVAR